MSQDAFGHHDAAYVLGGLSPADRQAFEEHLDTCESCRRAVAEVAGLPGLLARVDSADLEPGGSGADSGPVPDTLLPRLLAEVKRGQRRRRTWTVATSAAAAAVVAAVSVGVTVGQRDDGSPEAISPPARVMKQVHQEQLSAALALEDVAWGTRVSITCTYAEGHYGTDELPSYALLVHTRGGATEQVATWRAVAGKPTTVVAATASRRSDITSVEVRTTTGEPVLRLNG